uniref:Uncharacterized protein n=1 Tax=Grammatophora oceanica TaxID=210454 RepID=A0A7S1Y6I2_9STRA|mmetsp:Transcript_30755/g.45553  ORF Transcript_30755/g.45553 Transcript_30755/m.45553 type:complete len:198 (+) Transcript_30755:188-781(+)
MELLLLSMKERRLASCNLTKSGTKAFNWILVSLAVATMFYIRCICSFVLLVYPGIKSLHQCIQSIRRTADRRDPATPAQIEEDNSEEEGNKDEKGRVVRSVLTSEATAASSFVDDDFLEEDDLLPSVDLPSVRTSTFSPAAAIPATEGDGGGTTGLTSLPAKKETRTTEPMTNSTTTRAWKHDDVEPTERAELSIAT